MTGNSDTGPANQPGTPTLPVAILITMVIACGPIVLASHWLYEPNEALGWPSIALFIPVATVLASQAAGRCHGRGWRAVAGAALSALAMVAVLTANVVAATVVIWAIHPPAAMGTSGWIGALLIGMILTLPVIQGASALAERWQAMGLQLRDLLFRDKPSRPNLVLGVVLGIAGLVTAAVLTLSFEGWMRAAYPGVRDYHVTWFHGLCMLSVMLFIVGTGPTDRRSAVRSVLGALAVFEVALAATITGAVAMVTQQTNIVVVLLMGFLLLIPVYAGAFILIAHRPGDEAADAGGEEETQA